MNYRICVGFFRTYCVFVLGLYTYIYVKGFRVGGEIYNCTGWTTERRTIDG